jgi:glutamyl-tRNA reductase
MAALAVKHLRHAGVGSIRVVNRSGERAKALAERTGSDHGDLDLLPAALIDADLVVSATGAAGYVVHHATVARAMQRRDARGLVLLDLAVPRDVDPEVAYVDGVRVVDIVSIRERIGDHDEGTAADIARAHELVTEEVHRWVVRRRGDELGPLIRAIRHRGDAIVQGELTRWASRFADLTPDEHEAVEALARGVAAKLLHDPIVELKERSEPGTDRAHAKLLAELLGIDLDDPR